jgi:hypothetical protein
MAGQAGHETADIFERLAECEGRDEPECGVLLRTRPVKSCSMSCASSQVIPRSRLMGGPRVVRKLKDRSSPFATVAGRDTQCKRSRGRFESRWLHS